MAAGSYDAIRVYLWLGLTDSKTPGRGDLLNYLTGMSNYMKSQKVPPERVDTTGKVVDPNGPIGFLCGAVPVSDRAKSQG